MTVHFKLLSYSESTVRYYLIFAVLWQSSGWA